VIMKRLRGDCATNSQGLRADFAAIARRFYSDCAAISLFLPDDDCAGRPVNTGALSGLFMAGLLSENERNLSHFLHLRNFLPMFAEVTFFTVNSMEAPPHGQLEVIL
jgi:hypothetical protein